MKRYVKTFLTFDIETIVEVDHDITASEDPLDYNIPNGDMKILMSSKSGSYVPKIHIIFEFPLYASVESSVALDSVYDEYGEQLQGELEIAFDVALAMVKKLVLGHGFTIDMDNPSSYEGSVSRYLWVHHESAESELLGSIFLEGVVKVTDHEFTLKDAIAKKQGKLVDIVNVVPTRVLVDGKPCNLQVALGNLDEFLGSLKLGTGE